MDEAKQVSQRIYDEVHSCLDSALFAAADVPDVLGEGVDEDNILWHDEAYGDQADEVQIIYGSNITVKTSLGWV